MNGGEYGRENYCCLLGLNPFREDGYETADIVRAIDSKKTKWERTVKAGIGGNRAVFEAHRNLSYIPDIRTTMDSQILRRNEFAEGRKILAARTSKLRRYSVILKDGSVCVIPSAAQNLAKNIGWEGIDGNSVIEAAGIRNTPSPEVVKGEITNAYEAMDEVGLDHPYEFVNTLVMISALGLKTGKLDETSSYDDFRGAFKTIYSRLMHIPPGKVPNQDAYIKTARCLNMTQTDDRIRDLIGYCGCRVALRPVLRNLDDNAGQPFDRAYIDGLIAGYVAGKDVDEDLALRIMEDYCIRKGYPANFSGQDSSLIPCPSCMSLLPFSDSLFFCPICGASVRTMCPKCGTVQQSSNRNCTVCGAPVADSRKAAENLDGTVRAYVNAGEIEAAKEQLSKLKTDFPKYGQTDELSNLVANTDNRYTALMDRIFRDSSSRNLYDLKVCVEDALRDFPDLLSDEEVRKRYDDAVEKVRRADSLCVEASSLPTEKSTDLYIRASEVCPDHPDAVAQLAGRPPEGPSDATAESRSDCIVLRYSVPEDRRGMMFCIYRGNGSYPEVDPSTVPLAETDKGAFSDPTPDPGVTYYYRIYSRRWGVLSRGFAECGPAAVVREVTNVSVTPLEDGLALRYIRPAGSTRVRVWRKEAGDIAGKGEEREIYDIGENMFEDRGLVGGQTYMYLFVAEYEHDGITERSLGTVFSGETPLYPDPVDDMIIRWNKEEGTYSARWTRTDRVDLYCSKDHMGFEGRTVPLETLSKTMAKIEPEETVAGGCTFALKPGSAIYVYPVVPVGRTGVMGTESLVANLRPFRDVEKRMEGTDCLLTASWPEGAVEAVAIVGGADDDSAAQKIVCTREEYVSRGYVRIPMGGASRRTVSMFAVYEIEGEPMRSIGISTDVWTGSYRKVSYTLKTEPVKGESDNIRVNIRVECKDAVSIPRCVMVLSAEGIPLKLRDGTVVWESDEPMVLKDGKGEGSFVIRKDRTALGRMRLFFPDKEEYSRFRFVHPLRRT